MLKDAAATLPHEAVDATGSGPVTIMPPAPTRQRETRRAVCERFARQAARRRDLPAVVRALAQAWRSQP